MTDTAQSTPEPEVEKRYAVYDNKYQRYIGPVTTTKPGKGRLNDLAVQHGGVIDVDSLEVREV